MKHHKVSDTPVDITVNIPELKLNAPVKSKFQKVKSTIRKIVNPFKKSQPKPKVKKLKSHSKLKNKLFHVKSKYEGKKVKLTVKYRIYKIYFDSFFKPEVPDLDITGQQTTCTLTPPPRIIEESDSILRTQFFDKQLRKYEPIKVYQKENSISISRLYEKKNFNPLFKPKKCKRLKRRVSVDYNGSFDADVESNDEVTGLDMGSALILNEEGLNNLEEWDNTRKVEYYLEHQLDTRFNDCPVSFLDQSSVLSGKDWYKPVPQEQTGFDTEWSLPLRNPKWEHISVGEDALGSAVSSHETSSYYGTVDNSVPDEAEWPSFEIRPYRRVMVKYTSYRPESEDFSGEDPYWDDPRWKKLPVSPGPFRLVDDETHCLSVREDSPGGVDCDDSDFPQVATDTVIGTIVTNPKNVEPESENKDDKNVLPPALASMLDFLSERVEKNYCYPVRDVGNCRLLPNEPSLLLDDGNIGLAVEEEVDFVEEETNDSLQLLVSLEMEEDISSDTLKKVKDSKPNVEVETILDSEFDFRGSQEDQAYDSRKGIRLLEWKKNESHEISERGSSTTLTNSSSLEGDKKPKKMADLKGIGALIRLFENFGNKSNDMSFTKSTPTLVG